MAIAEKEDFKTIGEGFSIVYTSTQLRKWLNHACNLCMHFDAVYHYPAIQLHAHAHANKHFNSFIKSILVIEVTFHCFIKNPKN